jgi:lysophospholipase L1-like esterase
VAEEDKHTVSAHDNEIGNYSKYYPKQIRYDYDKETGERFQVSINNRGFRGGEYRNEKRAGVVRVLTLGASSTFGYHNRDDETYPYYLEKVLNTHPCSASVTFEVINLGIPHLRSENILSLFLTEGLLLDPDVVTFYEGVNDTRVETGVLGTMQRMAVSRRVFQAMRDHFLSVKFVDSFLDSAVRRYTSDQVARHIQGKSEHFLGNLSKLREETRKRGILLIVATQQAKSNVIDRQGIRGITYQEEADRIRADLLRQGDIGRDELFFVTHQVLMKDLRSWATINQVPLADIIQVMDQRRDHLLSWVHLTPAGNRMIADVLAERILSHICQDRGGQRAAVGTGE